MSKPSFENTMRVCLDKSSKYQGSFGKLDGAQVKPKKMKSKAVEVVRTRDPIYLPKRGPKLKP